MPVRKIKWKSNAPESSTMNLSRARERWAKLSKKSRLAYRKEGVTKNRFQQTRNINYWRQNHYGD